MAASNSPDKAHAWLGKVWEKDASETELRDPEGFSPLDAAILSGLTNILGGDFARQRNRSSRRNAGERKTAPAAFSQSLCKKCAVYDMEDLMNCAMVNENFTAFIRSWDTILGVPRLRVTS